MSYYKALYKSTDTLLYFDGYVVDIAFVVVCDV